MKDEFFDYIRSKQLEKNINRPVPLPSDPTKPKPIVQSVSTPNIARKRKRSSLNGVN